MTRHKQVTQHFGMKGHFWNFTDWKWGTIYGYSDDALTVPVMRMTSYGPLVFFEI